MPTYLSSEHLRNRAGQVSPHGVHSPVRAGVHVGGNLPFITRGDGPFLYSVEGKRYVDFCMGFGPLLFGHAPSFMVHAVREQVENGSLFGACHPLEVDVAERILSFYRPFEQVRFLNSGTEAVMAAIRLARGYTGRDDIVLAEGGYHGHSDSVLAQRGVTHPHAPEKSSTPQCPGVPSDFAKHVHFANWDTEAWDKLFAQKGSQIAAILIEPVAANNGLLNPGAAFLAHLKELAHRHGALLIFDEVITGQRLSMAGAVGYFDVVPDMVILGKVLGGGLPLSAVVAPRKILEQLAPKGPIFQAGTFCSNPLSLSAAQAVCKEIEREPDLFNQLERRTQMFSRELYEILSRAWLGDKVSVHSVGSLFWISYDGDKPKSSSPVYPCELSRHSREVAQKLFRQALNAGVYFAPSPYEVGFLSTVHTEDVLDGALESLKKGLL